MHDNLFAFSCECVSVSVHQRVCVDDAYLFPVAVSAAYGDTTMIPTPRSPTVAVKKTFNTLTPTADPARVVYRATTLVTT